MRQHHRGSRGDEGLRLQQLNEVLTDCRRYVDQMGLVIAGDFNLDAGAGYAASALRKAGFRDAVRQPGIPTTIPHGGADRTRVIDWIFVSDESCSEGRVHNEIRASDHYPVSATLAALPQYDCMRRNPTVEAYATGQPEDSGSTGW